MEMKDSMIAAEALACLTDLSKDLGLIEGVVATVGHFRTEGPVSRAERRSGISSPTRVVKVVAPINSLCYHRQNQLGYQNVPAST